MSNILTETPPARVETESGTFEPVTDFRAGIEFEIMVERGENNLLELFRPYYPKGIPTPAKGAIEAALWLYKRGNTEEETETPVKATKQAYSFAVDSAVIYADFLRYYNIDLSTASLCSA